MEKNLIIAAGGQGARMGTSIPKQFLLLGGKPILMHTIERFACTIPNINIIIVLPASQIAYWHQLCMQHSFTVSHTTVQGGETRFHSVQNGLQAVCNDGLTAIHDAVRPFVSAQTIARCFTAAQNSGAAIPVLNPVESIRKIEGSTSHTCQRSQYRMVQTPQVFTMELLRRAYSQPFSERFTDDASAVEATGAYITLVEGNVENIKLTSPFDLMIAEVILAGQFKS